MHRCQGDGEWRRWRCRRRRRRPSGIAWCLPSASSRVLWPTNQHRIRSSVRSALWPCPPISPRGLRTATASPPPLVPVSRPPPKAAAVPLTLLSRVTSDPPSFPLVGGFFFVFFVTFRLFGFVARAFLYTLVSFLDPFQTWPSSRHSRCRVELEYLAPLCGRLCNYVERWKFLAELLWNSFVVGSRKSDWNVN